jgi:hypothetical protein
MMGNELVHSQLARLLELSPPQESGPPHSESDWQALEQELGGSLPEDYRELCRRFPLSHFFVNFIVPTGLAKHYEGLLKNFRRRWEGAKVYAQFMNYTHEEDFKIAPGNLIPMASTTDGDVVAWHVTNTQPWPLVTFLRNDFDHKPEVFYGTATEFFFRMHEHPMPFESFKDAFAEDQDAAPGTSGEPK